MKFDIQTKYFINGLILLASGLLCVTYLPLILKGKFAIIIESWIYYQIEFFLLVACAVFYVFSPKYYKQQIFSMVAAIIFYLIFAFYR